MTTVSSPTPVSPVVPRAADHAELDAEEVSQIRRLVRVAWGAPTSPTRDLRFVDAHPVGERSQQTPELSFAAIKRALRVMAGALLAIALLAFALVLIGWAIGLFVGAAGAAFGALGTIRRAKKGPVTPMGLVRHRTSHHESGWPAP